MFVHLHLHSEYSLLDGACRISDIPKAAKENGCNAVAITDHGNMYGVVDFYKACKKEDVKPIIGCEIYVAPRTRFDRDSQFDRRSYHLVLLVENEIGYKNLIKLQSKCWTDGFYSVPRADFQLLEEYHEGLIALSGCISGQIPALLLNNSYNEAVECAKRLDVIYGHGNFYIELQNHGLEQEKQVIPQLVNIANELDIPLVATNDVHYLNKSDAENQAVLMAIQTNTTLDKQKVSSFNGSEFYFKSEQEMRTLFADIPAAIDNTAVIADRCNYDFDFSKKYLPSYKTPNGEKCSAYLTQLAKKGYESKIKSGEIVFEGENDDDAYRNRMTYELFIVDHMGYNDYYLIVWDFVNYAKEHGIPVGPGRGSGAGSLVAYLIGITEVDPIKYNLLFERFLNPERVSMPDFDIDFCYERRDEVIEYVRKRYGEDHVSQIITFGTMAARAVVRDVGRVLGMPYEQIDNVEKYIPKVNGILLSDCLNGDLKQLYDHDEWVKRLIDISMALEGMPRHSSTHAAGVVISENATSDYVPVAVNQGIPVTQYDMDTIAELGLLKFDFLALRYLTIVNDAVKLIRQKDVGFNIKLIDDKDAETFAMIGDGRTDGVFQLESSGMKQLLMSLRPQSLSDIMIAIALYRPGPMDSIPKYLENRKNKSSIKYPVDKLADILDETSGCIVYQEQVMRIFRIIAGYSFGKADIIRRIMAKKKTGELEKERDGFIKGAARNFVSEDIANRLFDEMSGFASYAFNKSHAAAYSVTSYRTAYLKCHYPIEYRCALLNSVIGNIPKMSEYISECSKNGISILPPDMNESIGKYSPSDEKNIRFGLYAIKNIGENTVGELLKERQSNGKFTSFAQFVRRTVNTSVNKKALEMLIKAGCFDSLKQDRAVLLNCYETIYENVLKHSRENLEGQLDMFGASGISDDETVYPSVPPLIPRVRIMFERESAGFCFSGHLLDEYTKQMSTLSFMTITSLLEYSGKNVSTVGILSAKNVKSTKKGDTMAFITLEDRYSEIECIVFPNLYQKCASMLDTDLAYYITGDLQIKEDESRCIIAASVTPLVCNSQYNAPEIKKTVNTATSDTAQPALKTPKEKKLYLRFDNLTDVNFRKCSNLLDIFDGNIAVAYYSRESGRYTQRNEKCDVNDYLLGQLAEIIGGDNVVFK